MSRRSGRWWWLLWPWALCAEPRDPFAPPPMPACAQTETSPTGWRLKGVIGQPTQRYGWVVTPAGQWLRLRPQQRVLAERWQVTQVQARSLEGADGRTGVPGEPRRHNANDRRQG